MIKWLLIVCATLVCQAALTAASGPPNIIYILADDLGYGDLGCYGQKRLETPHIDSLARDGMKFTQHYSGSTVCAPSRCVLMTGLHTGHAQVRGNKRAGPKGASLMTADTVSIPRALKAAGYATGMFGKWGLGEVGTDSGPMKHFDAFCGYTDQRLAHNFYPEYIWNNDEKLMLNREVYSHDVIMTAALDFIEANRHQPFFCYIPTTIPHAAMQAPPELHAKYREKYPQFDDKKSKYGGANVQNPVAGFHAMIEHLDNDVGRVLALLEKLGVADNTIIMFTSDNGAHKEGGHNPEFWDSNGPLRGLKRDLYEGGVRTPLVVRWTAKISPGSVSDHISGFQDMLPTFCDAAAIDIDLPSDIDGVSMMPTLTGQGEQVQHPYLYWEFTERAGAQAIRKGDLKAVRVGVRKDRNAPIELYDLSVDIGEQNNIADQHPEIVDLMGKLFDEARTATPVYPLYPK